MGGSLRQLTSRQLERLKSELAEVIIANFCYPAFLDYRLNTLRTRPVDRRKRQEVWAYVNSVNFNALGNMDVASMDFRRFVERVFLRYTDVNRALIATASARQVAAIKARVPQLALAVARGLADYLILSEASTFGQARLVESWSAAREGLNEPTWEEIEKSTQVLQTTLVYLRTGGADTATISAVSARTQLPNGASPDISTLPTRMLSPVNNSSPLAAAGMTNGAHPIDSHSSADHALANGVDHAEEALSQFSPFLGDDELGGRGQFRGPRRSPTASRPVDRPPTPAPDMPSDAPAAAPRATTSRPIQPPVSPPPVPPAAEEPPAASQPPALPPVAAPQSAMASDAWQALLMRAEPEEPPPVEAVRQEPVRQESEPPASPLSSEQPDFDLADLPESFAVPRALDLPPDLAELYGDYLRDARSARLDLSGDAEEADAADGLASGGLPLLPPSETDEEVDALFTALTTQMAAHEAESTSLSQPLADLPGQPSAPSVESAPQTWNGAQSAAYEPAGALPPSVPLDEQRAEQSAPAALPKHIADGDVMIFSQLQHQISTWVKMAAVSHQIDLTGRDAPELVAELRRMAALEEAELQVIEALVALCYRVTATKQATMDDYKQAMMLYLLHHRSRLAL